MMSFARRVLIASLIIQVVGFLREIFFVIGPDHFLNGLAGGNPTILAATVVMIGAAILLVPVWRGNRWATLATIPLMALLLLAAIPVFAPLFGAPSTSNFDVWLTITVLLVAAALAIPFAILATLEAFGRRGPGAAIEGNLFSPAALLVAGVVGSVVGMTLLAVAVVATPVAGGTLTGGAPDAYTSITMRDLRFAPDELRLASGQTTAIFVVNEDGFDHSFDVDELDIHVHVPGGQTTVVTVTPESGDRFQVYCGIPGHTEAGMVGQLAAD